MSDEDEDEDQANLILMPSPLPSTRPQAKGASATSNMKIALNRAFRPDGIEITDVIIKDVNLPQKIQDQLEQKVGLGSERVLPRVFQHAPPRDSVSPRQPHQPRQPRQPRQPTNPPTRQPADSRTCRMRCAMLRE